MSRQAWDQLPDESAASYARFLLYRNLGMGRSIEKASQEGTKRQGQTPGLWGRESVKYQWVDRAHSWDIDRLERQGEAAALAYVAALQRYVEGLCESLLTMRPKSFQDVTEALKLLSSLFPGAALASLIEAYRDGQDRKAEE